MYHSSTTISYQLWLIADMRHWEQWQLFISSCHISFIHSFVKHFHQFSVYLPLCPIGFIFLDVHNCLKVSFFVFSFSLVFSFLFTSYRINFSYVEIIFILDIECSPISIDAAVNEIDDNDDDDPTLYEIGNLQSSDRVLSLFSRLRNRLIVLNLCTCFNLNYDDDDDVDRDNNNNNNNSDEDCQSILSFDNKYFDFLNYGLELNQFGGLIGLFGSSLNPFQWLIWVVFSVFIYYLL